MKKVAVILAGSGFMDGSEIREAVITLLEIDRNNAQAQIFAPNLNQHHVIDHLSGKETSDTRNVLTEAARIARGQIKPLDQLNPLDFDALIMPGGNGVAKNMATVAFEGAKGKVATFLMPIIESFAVARKPIGAICISPALIAIALKNKVPTLTLGNSSDMLEKIGVGDRKCDSNEIVVDEKNLLVSTPAYMNDDRISNIADGIAKLVKKVLEMS